MTTRIVEGKKPYTGGTAIEIDENKVISLRLRDENNLIIYDAGDNEIYVDLQLPDGIRPLDAFPVGVTTGRVLVADDWDKTGTIICAKTTSGDVIKLLYADEGTLWIDNGTGTFKQIYFKSDVDAIIATLTAYINAELAKKQNGVVSATAPESPAQGDLWYDTTSNSMKVYDGTAWQSVGGGSDIVYATQAEYNALLPGALTDNKHYFIYTGSSPRLPAEYQEVEYIQSSGTQFIDTGYLITPTTEVSLDYQFTNASDQDFAFGVGNEITTSNGITFCVYSGKTNNVLYFKAGISDGAGSGTWLNDGPSPDTNRHKFVLNNGHFLTYNSSGTLQSDVTTSQTITRTATHSFGLFCWWRLDTSEWANKTSAKLYGCEVKDNGILQRDFIPCYRIADSVIGLYDLVNDVFYTNSGTGTFTKGSDV